MANKRTFTAAELAALRRLSRGADVGAPSMSRWPEYPSMTAEDAAEDAARYVVNLTLKERAERLQLLLRRSHSSPEL